MNADTPKTKEKRKSFFKRVTELPFSQIPMALGLDILINALTLLFLMRFHQWKLVIAFAFLPIIPVFLNLQIPILSIGVLGLSGLLMVLFLIEVSMVWQGEKYTIVDRWTYLRVLSGVAVFSVACFMATSIVISIWWYVLHIVNDENLETIQIVSILGTDPLRIGASAFLVVICIFMVSVFPVWLVMLARKDLPNWPIVKNKPMYLAVGRMWKSARFLRMIIPLIMISVSPIHLIFFRYLPKGYGFADAYGIDPVTFQNDPWYALLYQTNVALHTALFLLLVAVLAYDRVVVVEEPQPVSETTDKPQEADQEEDQEDDEEDEEDEIEKDQEYENGDDDEEDPYSEDSTMDEDPKQ